jgi:hypothetical protein
MYVSEQLLRVHHDEWLRHAETRRQIKHAAAAPGGSVPARRRVRIRRPALRLGRSLGQG